MFLFDIYIYTSVFKIEVCIIWLLWLPWLLWTMQKMLALVLCSCGYCGYYDVMLWSPRSNPPEEMRNVDDAAEKGRNSVELFVARKASQCLDGRLPVKITWVKNRVNQL